MTKESLELPEENASFNLGETFTVSKVKKSLKNSIVSIVFLKITEKLGLEWFVTRFCNKMMEKPCFLISRANTR